MTTNNFEVILLAYLDARAKFDEQFAIKYNNPKKSIKECARYICNEMAKKAENGCAVGTDEDVFGMAVHYYDEPNLDCSFVPDNVAKVVATINPEPKKIEKPKREPKPTPKKAEAKKTPKSAPNRFGQPTAKAKAKTASEPKHISLFGDYNPFK